MIDWHSHILPGIDDGSKNIDESIELLQMLSKQDIDTVVATPHFYANDESVTEFIERRQKSYENLLSVMTTKVPHIMLGAEVRYYPGINKLSELSRLSIGNSKLLLLEMPMAKWTDYTVRELVEIASARDVKLILAHIDRYLPMQSNNTWSKLYESGIMMQVNASFFTELFTKHKALSFLRNGYIHMIGSDCHSIKNRPPHLDKAYDVIRKKFGNEFISQFNEYGYSLLTKK